MPGVVREPRPAPGPLVSVITPTWQRPGELARCVASVQAQTYRNYEHLVVSDGPSELQNEFGFGVRLACLPFHDPAVRWGLRARAHALSLARGGVIAYLDDDDTWRPGHLAAAVRAMQGAAVGWTRMAVWHRGRQVGELGGRPAYGRIATSQMFHRRELLDVSGWQDEELPDWGLVERWLVAGAGWVAVDEVTADYYRHRPVATEGASNGRSDLPGSD